MDQRQFQSCIEACDACASACDRCELACLQEPDVSAMARCIALDIDCAALCRLAAGFMARGSEMTDAICLACQETCEACGDECAKYPVSHCQECARACQRCADECGRMLEAMPPRQPGGHAGAAVH